MDQVLYIRTVPETLAMFSLMNFSEFIEKIWDVSII